MECVGVYSLNLLLRILPTPRPPGPSQKVHWGTVNRQRCHISPVPLKCQRAESQTCTVISFFALDAKNTTPL